MDILCSVGAAKQKGWLDGEGAYTNSSDISSRNHRLCAYHRGDTPAWVLSACRLSGVSCGQHPSNKREKSF